MSATASGAQRRIAPAALRAGSSDVLVACDLEREAADAVAAVLVATDLRGVHTHGVALLPWYAEGLRSGRIAPQGHPAIVRDQGASAVIDAGGGMGHLAALAALRLACERAAAHGVAAVAVRRSSHCGAIGHYTRLAADTGMVGMVFATSVPTMAPPGGHERVLGNNPWSVAVPMDHGAPVVVDSAFSAVSRGRIVGHARDGEPLEDGWALDADGRPTVDPAAALAGLLQPIGGYKGAGLALAVGLLATVAGAGFGEELGSLSEGSLPGRDGLLALALNPDAFDEAGAARTRAAAAVDRLRSSAPVPGGTVTVPGDRSDAVARRNAKQGVPLDDATRDALVRLCGELGLEGSAFT